MKNPKELQARFPYMFAGRNIGISISKGWFSLFASLCQEIDAQLGADKRDFHWLQAKEKFGAARWYWNMSGQSSGLSIKLFDHAGEVTTLLNTRLEKPANTLAARIHILIEAAQAKTHSRCIVCGDTGRHDNQAVDALVLCDKHAEMRKTGGDEGLPPFWFNFLDNGK